MAAENATTFPIRGQAYRVLLHFRDTSGNLITSWSSPAAILSKDGAATASTGSAPVEIGTSGMGYLELTAAEMTANSVQVKATVSNANATAFIEHIKPLIAEPTGNALSDSVIRFEKLIYNLYQYWINKSQLVRGSGALTVYKADGTTQALSATHSNTGEVAEKSELI